MVDAVIVAVLVLVRVPLLVAVPLRVIELDCVSAALFVALLLMLDDRDGVLVPLALGVIELVGVMLGVSDALALVEEVALLDDVALPLALALEEGEKVSWGPPTT